MSHASPRSTKNPSDVDFDITFQNKNAILACTLSATVGPLTSPGGKGKKKKEVHQAEKNSTELAVCLILFFIIIG